MEWDAQHTGNRSFRNVTAGGSRVADGRGSARRPGS